MKYNTSLICLQCLKLMIDRLDRKFPYDTIDENKSSVFCLFVLNVISHIMVLDKYLLEVNFNDKPIFEDCI